MKKTITLKILGMHCTSCAMNIDFDLEDLNGVAEACTNYAKQQTVVTFDPQKANPEKIISTVRSIDEKYDAVVVNSENL